MLGHAKKGISSFGRLAGAALAIALAALLPEAAQAGDGKLKAICSTYPIYQLTRNVAEGSPSLELELLVPPQAGCPHDYSITPQDLKRLSKADVVIINGLKMEPFLDAALKSSGSKAKIVDSSEGVKETLEYTPEEGGKEDDEHSGVNPHLFASPRMAAKLALNIAAGLAKSDPKGAALYERNAKAYAARLNALADEFATLTKSFENKRVFTEHGVFDYLARDVGMEVCGVVRSYEQESQAPSAASIIRIVRQVQERKAGAIVTEPQYPDAVGGTIAREAKVPVVKLDPVASGPENAPLGHYEAAMRGNMESLKRALGGKSP